MKKFITLFSILMLTGVFTALLLWALHKEEQVTNWIPEPDESLMDFKVK